MSNLTYYDNLTSPSPIGPIDVTTYLQWLRDNPYSLAVQQQNDMLYFLQILEAVKAKEAEQGTILHMLAERINSFLNSSKDETKDMVSNLSTEDRRRIISSADNLEGLSTKAFNAEFQHLKANCAAARVIVEDTDLEEEEKIKIRHQITRLENVIGSSNPGQIISTAEEIHPAIPLIVLGGIPHNGRIVDAEMLQREKFAVLSDEIADACGRCSQHLVEHFKESGDDDNCSLLKCHVKQHLLAKLLLQRLKADDKYDTLQTLRPEERDGYVRNLDKLTSNTQWLRSLHQSVLTRKERDSARERLQKDISTSRVKLSLS